MKKLNLKQLPSVLDWPAWILGGLIFFSLVLYGQVLFAPFVYDDHELLLASPLIQSLYAPFENWLTAATKIFTYFTFALNHVLGGENPFGYHFVNVVLHGCNAGFLYFLVLLLFETPLLKNSNDNKNKIALIAALIFLCHPLQTESVSHIWQRSELLSGFFYFLTLLSYLKGRLGRGGYYFLFSALSFVPGFYSKGTIVSFFLLILLIEDVLFDTPATKLIFLRMCGIGGILCLLLNWDIQPVNFLRRDILYALMVCSGSLMSVQYFYGQIIVVAQYILLTFFPFYQNLDHTVTLPASFWDARVIVSLIFLFGVLTVAVRFLKKNRLIALGIFWFFLTLLPSSLLGGREPMVEHRLYFPLCGFAIAIASIFCDGKKQRIILVLWIIALIGLTLARNHLWSSPQLLFEDTVRKSPNKARPAVMLGTVYLAQGELQDAHGMFAEALKLDPQSAEAYNNLGVIYLQVGQSMQAEEMFEQAIKARPTFAPAYVNLGYFALGLGDSDRAAALFKKAITLGRKDVEPALKRALQ